MKLKTVLLILGICFLGAGIAFPCTDFQVKAKDGGVVIGRSMELSMDLESQIWIVPRREKRQSVISETQKGIAWTSKYGYLAIDSLNKKELISDGINEKGLSVEVLNFPGSVYQEYEPGKSLALTDLVPWMLGNFATVEEVKEAIAKIDVVSTDTSHMPISGAHYAVHDANGSNIAIEFIDGRQKIYDNPLGVMTNRPNLEWHLTNLRNYINLDNYDNEPKVLGVMKIESLGTGNGWFGIPGDWTPPARFVRAAMFIHKAPQPQDISEALILANHVLYTVDIPRGLIVIKEPDGEAAFEFTQWVVLKDLTNKVLYYRSYKDGALKMIDLKKLNFAAGTVSKSIPIDSPPAINEVTEKLQ